MVISLVVLSDASAALRGQGSAKQVWWLEDGRQQDAGGTGGPGAAVARGVPIWLHGTATTDSYAANFSTS